MMVKHFVSMELKLSKLNFSAISQKRLIGRLLRFLLYLIPPTMVVPVLQGSLRGKKWITGSGNHGCWLGSYEYEKQTLFAEIIKEGSIVYDIGAHVGYYTLLASELTGPGGKVIAFEPLPENIRYMKEHLRLNRCKNVTVYEAAVAEHSGSTFFEYGKSNYTGNLSSEADLKIKMVSLDDLFSRGEIPIPDYMKIDVEGAELLVLSGAKSILVNCHPTILLATHGIEMRHQCGTFLRSIGYELQSINEKNVDETDELIAFIKSA